MSIIINLYNEQQTIESFCMQMSKNLKNMTDNYECIFLDNGSHDQTLPLLKSICANDFHFHYIALCHNLSIVEAYYIGMQYAQGDFILFMNTSYPPYMILELYHIMISKNINRAGGMLINQQNHSSRQQHYFKIFDVSQLKPYIEEYDLDGFKAELKHNHNEMYWLSYTNLEEQKSTFLQRLIKFMNFRYEQRMIYAFLFSMLCTILLIPSILILHYHLDASYSFFISLILTCCVMIVMEITHSRFCCFYIKRRRNEIKETTFQ